MEYRIVELTPADFPRCGEIWDLTRQPALAARFREALAAGERRTWVCEARGRYIAEVSLVFDMRDTDYTLTGRRAYVSHLVVHPEHRRQGLGQALLRHVCAAARALGYAELTVGVDLDNCPALRLYAAEGFDRILHVDRDEAAYVKLLKTL